MWVPHFCTVYLGIWPSIALKHSIVLDVIIDNSKSVNCNLINRPYSWKRHFILVDAFLVTVTSPNLPNAQFLIPFDVVNLSRRSHVYGQVYESVKLVFKHSSHLPTFLAQCFWLLAY